MAFPRENRIFLLSKATEIIQDLETLCLNEEVCSRNLKFIAGACSLPKKNKKRPLGEDAFFICNSKQTVGVADGVGSYADSGMYARELMDRAYTFVRNPGDDPMTVLNHAFENTKSKGASTACIITLKDNTLRAVNVGDSGFMVIRGGGEKIVYRSPIQQRSFNSPFQLSFSSDKNSPSDGDEIAFEVERGDVIVAATDGLFDNVFDSMVIETVKSCLEADDPPEDMASKLGNLARKMSLVTNKPSPFTEEAIRNGLDRKKYMGGKYDDVTVVIAYIQ